MFIIILSLKSSFQVHPVHRPIVSPQRCFSTSKTDFCTKKILLAFDKSFTFFFSIKTTLSGKPSIICFCLYIKVSSALIRWLNYLFNREKGFIKRDSEWVFKVYTYNIFNLSSPVFDAKSFWFLYNDENLEMLCEITNRPCTLKTVCVSSHTTTFN